MINLDNKDELLKNLGGDSVVISINSLHKQLEQSLSESQQVNLPDDYRSAHSVYVCGMGGSRFPALINYYLFKTQLRVPMIINDDYIVPGSVNETSLVILSSYSGSTEEVLYCAEEAKKRKAKILTISSGGALADWAKQNGYPSYVFNTVHNPSQQPRIGFGYSVGANIGVLLHLGMIDIDPKQITDAITKLPGLMQNFSIDIPKNENHAKQLADAIYNRYPYYLVSEFLTGIGNAIQNQTNETAKAISSYRVIPELNHHMMEGLKFPVDLKEMAVFILFHSSFYSERIQKRFLVTKEVIEKNNISTIWHELRGETTIEQAFELMGLGSYVSMYLAALYEQDPNAIPYVDYFKSKLKQM
ncbi:MAG: SIS domain-containing protein [Patescibacteria group bacterium]